MTSQSEIIPPGYAVEDVEIETSLLFDRVLEEYKNKILLLRGGSSSTKTYTSLTFIAIWLLSGDFCGEFIPVGVASVARKFATSLPGSVIKDFDDILAANGWEGDVTPNKTLRRYHCGRRYVEFIGLDDPKKMKGPRRDIGYLNEATELDQQDFFQFELRTRKKLIVDFNPDDEDHWINTEIEQRRRVLKWDVDLVVSTYKDNPFLTQSEIDSIEYYREVDPQAWAVYGLWEYGRIKGRIFENVTQVDSIDDTWKFAGHGLDFWYTNDPTSLVQLYTRNGWNDILLDELIYETWLTNPAISEAIKDWKIPGDDQIVADSSEPKSIKELVDLEHNVIGVKKGEDSIRFGISLMKSKRIFVTRTSINLIREFKKYIWKPLANGKPWNRPIDKFNHAIDAARYICMWYFSEYTDWDYIFTSKR